MSLIDHSTSGRHVMAGTAALLAAMFAWSVPVQAQLSGSAMTMTSDKPVQVDGDRLEVLEDQGKAIFEGNVRVVQGETILRTGKLEIYYVRNADGSVATGGAQIDRLEASNGVNIQSGTQVATGETGTFDMASEILTLSGKRVTLSEDGNVATGCKLTVNMRNSRAKLEGCGTGASRPTILIQPQNRP